jgi:hypothetical protein
MMAKGYAHIILATSDLDGAFAIQLEFSPHGLVGADGTVFTTLFVRGSMRETVPAT